MSDFPVRLVKGDSVQIAHNATRKVALEFDGYKVETAPIVTPVADPPKAKGKAGAEVESAPYTQPH